ncbi:MAG: hypothetical protein AAF125_19845 [Chloroflexota bacterium]
MTIQRRRAIVLFIMGLAFAVIPANGFAPSTAAQAGDTTLPATTEAIRLDVIITADGGMQATASQTLLLVQALPATGEPPWWRSAWLMLGGLVLTAVVGTALRRQRVY